MKRFDLRPLLAPASIAVVGAWESSEVGERGALAFDALAEVRVPA